MLTDGNCIHAQICTVIEKLYAGLLSLAPYIAWKMGAPVETAEDALQDAIVLVLQRADAAWLAEFLAASPKKQIGYFLTAIHNNALKAIIRNRPAPLLETPREDKTAPDPAEEAERAETRRAVREAIQRLRKAQREVMELDMEEYTDQEITEKLHISPGATRKRRFDAGENMRKILQSQDVNH